MWLSLLVVLAFSGVSCVQGPEDTDWDVDQVEQEAVVCPAGTTLPGIDVSYWQGAINWNAVAGAGIRFAIIRVSDGTTTVDTRFNYNWSEARRVGITRGAYQFFRPGQDPVAQANLLLNMMGTLQGGDLPPTLDVEVTDGVGPSTYAARIQTWMNVVQNATGVRPIIYTGKYFWQDHVGSYAFSSYPLWIANWGVTCPNIPVQWSNWVFHQYTDSGSVAGISGYVDRNRFNGNAAALASLTVSSCQCSPGATQSQACGNCGTRSRTCRSSCLWGAWSACTGQGACSPGTTQSRACCDCGSQSRACSGSCQWNPWSTCAGPDPGGGTQVCDTGEPGPCGPGRMRCQQGCLACVRVVDPEPERCDTVDNDCDGELNNGDPTELGTPPPDFAARVVDRSLPQVMRPGETATAWVTFENVGTATWPAYEVWLRAETTTGGQPSALHDPETWPAHDVAALNPRQVPPGDTVALPIQLHLPADADADVTESFRLVDPYGQQVACPNPVLPVVIRLSRRPVPATPAATGPGSGSGSGSGSGPGSGSSSGSSGGCATGGTPGAIPGLVWFLWVGLFGGAVRRRRRSQRRRRRAQRRWRRSQRRRRRSQRRRRRR